MSIPAQRPVFDESRNASAVRPVPFEAVNECRRVCRAWAKQNPKHLAWLRAGAPAIRSNDEHRQWFGEGYKGVGARRRAA